MKDELRCAMLAGRCLSGQLALLVVNHLALDHPIRIWMRETFQEKSPLFQLPTALIASIFAFLPLADHSRLSRTTRRAQPIASLRCASPYTMQVATTRSSAALLYLTRNKEIQPKRLELHLKFRQTAEAKSSGADDAEDYDEEEDGDAEVYVDVRVVKRMVSHVCEIVDGEVECPEDMDSCWDSRGLTLLSDMGLKKLHTFRTRLDAVPSFFKWARFPELRDLQVRTVTPSFFSALRQHRVHERLTHLRFSKIDDSYHD